MAGMHGGQFSMHLLGLGFHLLDIQAALANIPIKLLDVGNDLLDLAVCLTNLPLCLVCHVFYRVNSLKQGTGLKLQLLIVAAGQGWERNTALNVKSPGQLQGLGLVLHAGRSAGERDLCHDGVVGADIGQHVIKTRGAAGRKALFFLQAQKPDG